MQAHPPPERALAQQLALRAEFEQQARLITEQHQMTAARLDRDGREVAGHPGVINPGGQVLHIQLQVALQCAAQPGKPIQPLRVALFDQIQQIAPAIIGDAFKALVVVRQADAQGELAGVSAAIIGSQVALLVFAAMSVGGALLLAYAVPDMRRIN